MKLISLKPIDKKYIGWVEAFFLVFVLWGLSNIILSFVTQVLELNKLIFTGTTFLSCSVCLLIYAGHGKLSKETFRSVDTWIFGIMMLANYFIALNLFALLTPTEVTLLERLSVVFSVAISWFFFARKQNNYQLAGLALIIVGIILVASNIPKEIALKVYSLMFLAGITQSLRVFVAESHRPHKKATEDTNIKSRCRVIGYVMFVVSMLFWMILIFMAWLSQVYETKLIIDVSFADFYSYKSILSGLVMGVIIYAPTRFFEFSSAEKIKTENFLTVGALSFFATWLWQAILAKPLGLQTSTFLPSDMLAGALITIGALIMAFSKIFIKDKKSEYSQFLKVDPQSIDDIEESRDIIANTLEHFDSNMKKTAEALGVSKDIIKAILENEEKNIAFKHIILKQVAKNYRKNVSQCDALTGLLNRNGFMTALKTASYEASHLSLYFIDLNKFKPVNDTYGHEAGDFILKQVGDRLRNLFENNSLITRLGGDEYCILLIGVDKKSAQSKIKRITAELEKDFSYESNLINISGSIGLACYPEDTKDPQSLLDLADKQMYVNKSER